MSEMKARIHQLAAQESPKLTRKQISDTVGCSPAYVTTTLGALRKYEKRTFIPVETKDPVEA